MTDSEKAFEEWMNSARNTNNDVPWYEIAKRCFLAGDASASKEMVAKLKGMKKGKDILSAGLSDGARIIAEQSLHYYNKAITDAIALLRNQP